MKYNITLNQPLMIENKLNVSQWCILDIISIASTWCDAISKDNEVYYWVARQKIAEELQALDLKADTIYRYIKQLAELGFVEYIKDGKKDLIRLSSKGKKLFSTMSEKNPNYYVGKKSENNSEKNPTYNNTNINNNTNIPANELQEEISLDKKTINEKFQIIWKQYSLVFLKEKFNRRGGYKQKAKKRFEDLINKGYSIKDIADLVKAEHKLDYPRDLENIFKLDSMKQFIEDRELLDDE